MKLAASLLLTLPGEPYLYYGEEIGMLGNKPDENIREPFLWKASAEDKLRTHWMKPSYSTDDKVRNLEAQMKDPSYIYNHYKKLLKLRHEYPALRQVAPVNLSDAGIRQEHIIAFTRPHTSGNLLIVHNMSGTEKTVELPASASGKKLLFGSSEKIEVSSKALKIPAYGSVILR